MEAPLLPADESTRLACLRDLDVLDTPSEERFDRITRLARALFDVPIALVSLVDETRQWFKSRQGLTATETPREISFCGHAILRDGVMWVENALRDERFHDNPLVVGDPNIRFYAGCPLRGRDGSRLGTLCVIGPEPRTWSPELSELLGDLGHVTETELASLQLGGGMVEFSAGRNGEERRARLDGPTGVWDREGFRTILTHGLDYCAEHQRPATLIVGRIDGWDTLQEAWTDQGGDILLAETAQVLRGCVRRYDAIGRTGECEFGLFLVGCEAGDAPERVATLRSRIAASAILSSLGIEMTFGHASAQPARVAVDATELLTRASGASQVASAA